MNKVFNICGGRKCCPTVIIGDEVAISDDYGGSVTITIEQAKELAKLLKKEVK